MEDTEQENKNNKSDESTILHDYWDLKGTWEEEEEVLYLHTIINCIADPNTRCFIKSGKPFCFLS
jgi:hypothetical protein